MRIRVTSPFRDRTDHTRLFSPGDVAEFDDGRARDIIARGLDVRCADPPKRRTKAKTAE